jgi:hypothetical protein
LGIFIEIYFFCVSKYQFIYFFKLPVNYWNFRTSSFKQVACLILMYLTCTIISVVEQIYGMAYIFTLLMFRKSNKTTINKIKTSNFYRSTSLRFSFKFRYFMVFQVKHLSIKSIIKYSKPNWRVCELLKCILSIQKQLTNRPQVITNQTDHKWTFVIHFSLQQCFHFICLPF